jgi:ABC-type transport system involved in multi-copper enzyme maturation permease subunit
MTFHIIARYTLLEALRNRLIWLIVIVIFAAIGLTGFLSELALTEKREIQLALLAALLRFAAIFLLATFVVASMVRESNDKGLELILALPIPRAGYLFGKMAGFAALAVIMAILFGLLITLLAPPLPSLLWTLSLILECWIVIAFSVLCVLSFNQVMPTLSAVMGFYLLARSITALQLISSQPLNDNTLSQQSISLLIHGLSALLPHFDAYTRTDWLVYHTGNWATILPLLEQSAIYLVFLSGAALFDLYRKNS